MGAIAIVLSSGAPVAPTVPEAMIAAAPHRGASSQLIVHGRAILAVVYDDSYPDAWVGASDGMAAAVTGSIDNAADLRADLARRGVSAGDGSPPALLIAAYRAYDDEFASRLRGVFAAAITDGRHVIAVRDQLGYRPLFHRTDEHGTFLASEAKQVVAGAGIPKEPDLEVVERIFFNATDDSMPSALRGVRRLAKSSVLWSDGVAERVWRYWEPERLLETAGHSHDELKERFDQLMDQAVSRCFTGPDVVSLSGGIDSPAIAAFGNPRHLERFGAPLHALTVVYPRYPTVDERRYVEPLAAELGLPLHLYEQESNALADLDRWVSLTDSPYRSAALAQYAEDYGRAKALGFRTVLSGEHAEFVAGMQWYQLEHYVTHGRWGPLLREIQARRSLGRPWPSIGRTLVRSVMPDSVKEIRNRLGRRPSLLVPPWVDRRRVGRRQPVPVRERWRRLQLTAFIGPGISLEAEEVCQAVSGVQSRKPWTDIDLWEFFLALPAEQKFPDLRPKSLVRELLRGRVPNTILDRRDKTVFDEAGLAEIDYPALRRYLSDPDRPMPGVDYRELRRTLDDEQLSVIDYGWARTLATVHAFLRQWGR